MFCQTVDAASHADFERSVSDPLSLNISFPDWVAVWMDCIDGAVPLAAAHRTTLRFLCYQRFKDKSSLMFRLVKSTLGIRQLQAAKGGEATAALVTRLYSRLAGASASRLPETHTGEKPTLSEHLAEAQFRYFVSTHPELVVLLGSVPELLNWLLRLDPRCRKASRLGVLPPRAIVEPPSEVGGGVCVCLCLSLCPSLSLFAGMCLCVVGRAL